ncbi:rhodanese-like domain-containing protein [Pseudoalteromonas ulvae]|uniref:Rhodanese domain-containing protein n=1 Tax=Pseudoalteromonas ulvae TaxID=107327 RepID=A0A244CSU1_PSEDV|nr:rhodanese-like domain-containing protein [Pseudoalteromonas ulvae]OUL58661.1 hypothetical protein B1199_10125 [Pseudoalteromonas ulvae]
MKFIVSTLLFCSVLLTSSLCYADITPLITQEQFLKSQQSSNISIIDVRSVEEFNDGHIPGAINIPHNQIQDHLELLLTLQRQPVVVYCRSGRRAAIAEKAMAELGLKDVHHLEGDWLSWQEKSLPVSTKHERITTK